MDLANLSGVPLPRRAPFIVALSGPLQGYMQLCRTAGEGVVWFDQSVSLSILNGTLYSLPELAGPKSLQTC